jgi:hypothetical protein
MAGIVTPSHVNKAIADIFVFPYISACQHDDIHSVR